MLSLYAMYGGIMSFNKFNQRKMCRSIAAEYLGVSSATLKKLPIPFIQYSRFGYAIYKKYDLDKFKESRTFTPKSAA